ncbi:MAG: alpha-mannosidase, partial [Chloroflexi bacterium]
IGHSHIDMAWLWRLCHTREKASRTFSTGLHLMRQYPEYRFMHSSPQLYKFLKEDYPDIYARVKERIRSGEWEITGGMWVEADTNLTSGESLIRQFLYGRRFIKEEFGVDTDILWLPDVFGYSAALPQIIRKSGIKYFLTSKMSWSQFNRFPYDTFNWRGIDGTEVLTHFITTPDTNWFYTYNGQLSAQEVKGIWDNYRQKDVNDELLLLFGWGDGGGGPTKEMLESARALKNMPGMPEVEIGKAEPFFERLGDQLEGKKLPEWDGELYLELHRGTYTSQGEIKRSNRKSEILYHNAEWLSSMAGVLAVSDSYPLDELRRGWEKILLNQFHDILPGSSIGQVYEDTRKDYDEITRIGQRAACDAQDSLLNSIPTDRESIVVFNPLSWNRRDLIVLPYTEDVIGKTLKDEKGFPAAYQLVEEAGEKKILLEAGEVPSLGYRVFSLSDQVLNGGITSLAEEPVSSVGFRNGEYYRTGKDRLVEPEPDRKGLLLNGTKAPDGEELVVRKDRLENRYYRLDLNEKGQISALYDKRFER